MVNPQLLEYVKQQVNSGVSRDEIIKTLISGGGWQVSDIQEAFIALNPPPPPSPQPVQQSQVQISPQDFSVPVVQPVQPIAKVQTDLTPEPVQPVQPVQRVQSNWPIPPVETTQAELPTQPAQPQPAVPPVAFNENIASSYSTFPTQQSKGKSKVALSVLVIIIVILIAAGGAYGYFTYFLQSPEKIVQGMISKLPDIKSVAYLGEIKVGVNGGNLLGDSVSGKPVSGLTNQQGNFNVTFDDASDIKQLDEPKGSFSFNISTDALSQGQFSFGLDTISIAKTLYVKLGDVSNFELFDLSSFKGQWIQFNSATTTRTESTNRLSQEQVDKIRTAVREAKIIDITEKMSSESIGGVDTYHYKYRVNKVALKNLLIEVTNITKTEGLTEKEITDFDRSLEYIDSLDGQIWIGKKDLFPYKVTFNLTASDTADSGASGNADAVVSFKDFNVPVQIQAPVDAKSLQEVIGSLFGGPTGTVSSSTKR